MGSKVNIRIIIGSKGYFYIFSFLLILLLLLSSCSSTQLSSQMIETAIAQTQLAIPSATPSPSLTSTITPTLTQTIDPCPYDLSVAFQNKIIKSLQTFSSAMKLLAIDTDASKMFAQTSMLEVQLDFMVTEYPACGKPVYDAILSLMDATLAWSNVIVSHGSKVENDAALAKINETTTFALEAFEKFKIDAGIID